MSATRDDLINAIAARIDQLPANPVRVAVDGIDGAGKTWFADELGESLRASGRSVFRASVDDFHQPQALRWARGRNSPEGYFQDSFDYLRLKKLLLDPLSRGGNRICQLRWFDHRTDERIRASRVRVSPNAILVLDGIFLHRDELWSYWDYSIFLQVTFTLSHQRLVVRDGAPSNPHAARIRRYVQGQQIYLAQCNPASKASVVIDNEHIDAPFVVKGR